MSKNKKDFWDFSNRNNIYYANSNNPNKKELLIERNNKTDLEREIKQHHKFLKTIIKTILENRL